MQTIGIADIMADYIISHKGEEYKIDLGLGVFIDFGWTDGKLRLKHYDEEGTFMESLPLGGELAEKEVKELLLHRMGVYEELTAENKKLNEELKKYKKLHKYSNGELLTYSGD